MLKLSELKPNMKKKTRKRVGRGSSAGGGTYAGRGLKGQKARSGGNIRPGFEGGRMPFVRQLPKKRGFRSRHAKKQIVNLREVNAVFADGSVISPAVLAARGLIADAKLPVKLLGEGKLGKRLEFKQIIMSATARKAVAAAGGKVSDAG